MLLHRLEQRGLGLGRRAVDFVGQDDVREDRAAHERHLSPFAGLLQNLRAGDVRRHEVRRELDALKFEMENLGDGFDQQRLGQARRAGDQAVPAGKERDATAIGFRYGAILAAQGPELDEKSLTQLKALSRICQAVVKLRRSDHNAARLKIEIERWELARQEMVEDKAEAVKRKLREALAAPVWGAWKKGERLRQFGGGKAAQFAVEYLSEVETLRGPGPF